MKVYLLIMAAACLLLLDTSCKKSGLTSSGQFKGKLILLACGTAAIDIEGPTGTGGGAVWAANATSAYNNAVTVNNYCYLAGKNLRIGDTFTFNIVTEDTSKTTCAITLCYIAGPEKHIYVDDVKIDR